MISYLVTTGKQIIFKRSSILPFSVKRELNSLMSFYREFFMKSKLPKQINYLQKRQNNCSTCQQSPYLALSYLIICSIKLRTQMRIPLFQQKIRELKSIFTYHFSLVSIEISHRYSSINKNVWSPNLIILTSYFPEIRPNL